WVGDFGAHPGDDLVFPAGAARLTNNNDFVAGTQFSTISFRGPDYRISGNSIILLFNITTQYPTPVDAAHFPQLSFGLTASPGNLSGSPPNFNLLGDPNLGLVLNGPVVFRDGSPEPFVTGRIIFNGVISGDTFINVTGDASNVVLTANNTVRGVGAQRGTLRIEGSIPNI